MNVNEQQRSPRVGNVAVVRRSAIAIVAVIALMAFAFLKRGDVAVAQDQPQPQPTTQPAPTPPLGRNLQPRAGRMRPQALAGAPAAANKSSDDADNDFGPAERGERGAAGRRQPPPTTQERDAAFEFMRDNAPARWRWFSNFPPDSPPRKRIGNMIAIGYRQIARFQESDPELYDILRRRVQVQDEAFRVMRGMWRNNYELNEDQTTIVRQKAAEVVELSMQERERRIARLEKQLKEQKAKLQADRANAEPLIDAQAKRMKDEAADMLRRVAEIVRQNNYPGFPSGMQQQNTSPTTEPSK